MHPLTINGSFFHLHMFRYFGDMSTLTGSTSSIQLTHAVLVLQVNTR